MSSLFGISNKLTVAHKQHNILICGICNNAFAFYWFKLFLGLAWPAKNDSKWRASARLDKRLVNCVCCRHLNPQEPAAVSATVSVCNNSASLIGFCGFPITPPDLHKSNGPLLNPDPAACSRHTPLSSTAPEIPQSQRKRCSYKY